ncbi:hypothetical protein BT93_K0419 [Corymbia citriodora subsp. variegata]|nr:hypothetical protein BT93_K0419 [Corymbia citriodora subsp. variegata]
MTEYVQQMLLPSKAFSPTKSRHSRSRSTAAPAQTSELLAHITVLQVPYWFSSISIDPAIFSETLPQALRIPSDSTYPSATRLVPWQYQHGSIFKSSS